MSLQLIVVGTRHCRVLRLYHSDANGIDMTYSQPVRSAHYTDRVSKIDYQNYFLLKKWQTISPGLFCPNAKTVPSFLTVVRSRQL